MRLSNSRLNKLIKKFLSEYLRDKSEETKGTYERSLREFQRFFSFSEWFVFTKEDVERYKKYLLKERKISPVSVSTYLTALRRLLDFFVEKKLIECNVARGVRGGYPRPDKYTARTITEREAMKLLSVVPTNRPHDLRDYLMIRLMMESAVSEHELVTLNVGDLVRHLTHYTLFVQAKGKKTKDESVEVSLSLGDHIKGYLSQRDKRLKDAEPMFVSNSNYISQNRMTARAVHYRLSHWIEKAGLASKGVSPNSIRHTAARLWLERDGLSVEEVRRRMRHRTVATTKFSLRW